MSNQMHLLILERYDCGGISEGVQYLQFDDRAKAELFARRLASEYFRCPLLVGEGDFAQPAEALAGLFGNMMMFCISSGDIKEETCTLLPLCR